MIQSINPATGKEIKSYNEMSFEEVKSIIDKTHEAFLSWRLSDFDTRKSHMEKASEIMKERKDKYARLMTDEMGKPIKQSYAEIEKCIWVCDYFADKAELFLTDEIIDTEASDSFVTFQPLGVVLAVMPWNFPFWQVFRFAAPNLMAGNAGILKHSSNVTGCALAIEEIFRDAGFPENLFRSVIISSKSVGDIIADRKIAAATLTGSVPAGKSVAEKAGSVLKKFVLELCGSDPYLIL
jgi:succinate-semialdehyde dehydrogenase/glutarate-semialdehyde dehydrogenase